MIIDCISDLHGHYPKFQGGDLLIIAGDMTRADSEEDWLEFEEWICGQNYTNKIIIAGNHDNFLQNMDELRMCKYWEKIRVTYLCDSGVEIFYDDKKVEPFNESCLDFKDFKMPKIKSLKVWGSPWTKTFKGMNPKCKAFTVDTEEELEEKFCLIPEDTDILITHSPPLDIFDKTIKKKNVGSNYLRIISFYLKPKLHVFGHIHECGGRSMDLVCGIFVNASHVNEHYEPVNEPVRIIL